MGLLHHNDSPLGAPAVPAWGGHGAQHTCKQPARMVHGACKECARGVQGAYKNGAWNCKEHARGAQGVCKEQRAWTELAWSMQGVCNKRASRPPEPQTKQRVPSLHVHPQDSGMGQREGWTGQTDPISPCPRASLLKGALVAPARNRDWGKKSK